MTSEALREHMLEKITPEKVARVRSRVGIRASRPVAPFNTVVTEDTIRHFVHGYGDDNPLFCDPAYAAQSRWGGVMAPVHYLNTMGERDPLTPEATPEEKAALGGGDPLRGIHAFYSGTSWEWWRPILPGRRMFMQTALVGVQEKRSQFAEKSVFLHRGFSYRDDTGALVAMRRVLMIHTERDTAAKKGKYSDVQRPHYSAEEVAQIDDAYAHELRRGRDTLYWEDVEVGAELPVMVKGPLTVTDIIFWHVGGNETGYNLSPLGLAYKNRKRIPKFYLPNEFGYPDAAQRCHWDDNLAQAVGNPYAYDYGAMREAWLAHYVYNWIGDDGWLWRFHSEMRRFNYIGDVTWIRGRVTGRHELPGPRFAVELDLWGQNQRGEITAPGRATVLLPSRAHGPVLLPDPPGGARSVDDLFLAVAEEMG